MSGHRRCVSNKAKPNTRTAMPYWKSSGFFCIGVEYRVRNSTIGTMSRSLLVKHLLFLSNAGADSTLIRALRRSLCLASQACVSCSSNYSTFLCAIITHCDPLSHRIRHIPPSKAANHKGNYFGLRRSRWHRHCSLRAAQKERERARGVRMLFPCCTVGQKRARLLPRSCALLSVSPFFEFIRYIGETP